MYFLKIIMFLRKYQGINIIVIVFSNRCHISYWLDSQLYMYVYTSKIINFTVILIRYVLNPAAPYPSTSPHTKLTGDLGVHPGVGGAGAPHPPAHHPHQHVTTPPVYRHQGAPAVVLTEKRYENFLCIFRNTLTSNTTSSLYWLLNIKKTLSKSSISISKINLFIQIENTFFCVNINFLLHENPHFRENHSSKVYSDILLYIFQLIPDGFVHIIISSLCNVFVI